MIDLVREVLSTGSDAAVIAFAYGFWRLDRRLVAIEQQMKIWLSEP